MILITVPHSTCIDDKNNDNHLCDNKALECAILLSSLLFDRSTLIISDINRSFCDLNRDPNRSPYCYSASHFFKQFFNEIDSNKYKILLDIHSFPNYTDPNLSFYLLGYNHRITNDYNKKLFYTLKKENKSIGFKEGAPDNFLMKYAIEEKGIFAIIIEFNESIHKSILNSIIKTISNFCINEIINK